MDQRETELVAAVRELSREKFVARAARHDREGSFPAENIAELKALGVPGMALPKALGGLEVGIEATARIMEEVAYGDGSTAVALNMHVLIADALTFLPPFPRRAVVLEDIAKHSALICGPGSIPTGELDNRKSGYRMREEGENLVVDGRAGFASMSAGATYVLVGGVVDRGEGAEPDIAVTLPKVGTPGLQVLDNWDSMGLRGTASNDVVCEGMVVPRAEALVIPSAMLKMLQQATQGQGLGLTQSRARGAIGILAIWLGLAQAAFDFTLDYVGKRHGYLAVPSALVPSAPGYRSEEAWAQLDIGQLEFWLESGRTVLYDTIARLGTPFPSQQLFVRHLVRTVYHLRRMSEEVSAGAMRVCGAHAYVRSSPLERIFRDMVGSNVMAWKTDELLLNLGRATLGFPVTIVGPAGA
jgi:alkylation response protein AidB-like acyl-CoA dehydrogenase